MNNMVNTGKKPILTDEDRAREVERLAEYMIRAATLECRAVINNYDNRISMSDVVDITNHNQEFNEVFYSIAEKIISKK
jgi:hypothetical protein